MEIFVCYLKTLSSFSPKCSILEHEHRALILKQVQVWKFYPVFKIKCMSN